MNKAGFSLLSLCFVLGAFAVGQQPPPQQLPANAAGNWTLYCKGPERIDFNEVPRS